jgi:hypothetical protein
VTGWEKSMGILSSFRRKAVRVIRAPSAGFLNLMGPDASDFIEEDSALLTDLFGTVVSSVDRPPNCDILFLYCRITGDGALEGTGRTLRELVRDSAARIVVVASPNTGESYIRAGKPERFGAANLVMTIDRQGPAFVRFFVELFSKTKDGVSMPVAWGQLAPQGGSAIPSDVPDCIFACEVGQLAFG